MFLSSHSKLEAEEEEKQKNLHGRKNVINKKNGNYNILYVIAVS